MSNVLAKFSSIQLGGLGGHAPIFGFTDNSGIFKFMSSVFRGPEALRQGKIITYHPQTHSASVYIDGEQHRWTCVFSDEFLSYAFGYSTTNPPREGEIVLVYPIDADSYSKMGIIIGRIAYPLCFCTKGDLHNDPDQYHRRLFTQLKDTGDREINCFLMPFTEHDDTSTQICSHLRPTDIYPGEFAHVNQHNCGIKGGLFSATLLGGGANLRMSALSNTARLSCEHYIRNSLHGKYHEFHNGRYLSGERDLSLYQEERLGGAEPQAKVWTDDSEEPVGGENQTLRPRIKELSGFFGHLCSRFCLRPDPNDSSIRVQGESMPNEAGVSRETIDPSGQYRLSSAGMLTIERIGRIPVPVRTAYPTEMNHDIKSTPEVLQPFEHDESDQCRRQLELYDRQAYDLKTQYARVDGLGLDEPDHHVPQEEELDPLKDPYDEKFFGNETVKLEKYDKRRAGMYIGEDGSVIIRDAWGSEIVMLGGNISLACAGNVMLLPGKTSMTIAGDDIVQKARNSVDIHSSEHDIRLSAARNMEIIGGADEGQYQGGVVIESKGEGVIPWDGIEKGEEARLSGITLRAKKQGIVVDGERVMMRSWKDTRIVSGDDEIDGNVSIGAKNIRARGEKIYTSTGDTALLMGSGSVSIGADNVNIGGSSGLTLTKSGQIPIPIKWVGAVDIASIVVPSGDSATEDLSKEKEAIPGFDKEALDKMKFGFRKSYECRTDQPWDIGGSGGYWKLYEPAWVQVCKKFEPLKDNNVEHEPYIEKPEWDNGRPFPGKEAEDSGMYVQLSGLEPKNITQDGFNKSRKEVIKKSEMEEKPIKSNYLVRTEG